MKNFWKIILYIGIALAAIFVIIQLIPYGRNHTNPPVIGEPNWDSAQTRDLAKRACFDCHSNETVWPWYSNVAPISWLVFSDVDEGRRNLNFSEYLTGSEELEEAGEVISEGYMPPQKYLIMHPEARLTQDEKQALIQGLSRSR